ncbi:TnsA endonuclease N-terminal domain-containing protein [Pseudoalteromonas sp. SSMSWG5]|uniref:TnsA endonuclease N-terminal domain-containing protein n=1 Tax=unclassified Pseudoalteromonas TaxID=194690 RepID=UPI000C6981E7|nr:TnsA endonuclease N-terminal domain-containing protein [Pseudoalteromonas sp. T1lg10]MBU77617.1 transposase [Pseudoalteromonadaceae bacterium]|tara:strand:- start:734 stop:1594 length:861 start_codon:yes stop_codon:yes gene_type:complete
MKKVTQPIITDKERSRIARYYAKVKKEGYRPWITVRQSHTIGQGQIIYSHKTKRAHHFLSRGELQAFFHFEANKRVKNILEQFPLPIADTMQVATELNIVHPSSYQEAVNFNGHRPAKTMTLDYLVIHSDKSRHAYNFKYSDALDKNITSPQAVARTNAKAEIERIYCLQNNISWTQLTEKSFDKSVTSNLRYFRECYDSPYDIDISDDLKSAVLCHLTLNFENYPTATVRNNLERTASDINLPLHQIQSIFQMLAYERVLHFDWTTEINLNRPLPAVAKEVDYVC